jgi:hypothetical protein
VVSPRVSPSLEVSSNNVNFGMNPRGSGLGPRGATGYGADCHGDECILLGACRDAACTANSTFVSQDGHLVLKSDRGSPASHELTTVSPARIISSSSTDDRGLLAIPNHFGNSTKALSNSKSGHFTRVFQFPFFSSLAPDPGLSRIRSRGLR